MNSRTQLISHQHCIAVSCLVLMLFCGGLNASAVASHNGEVRLERKGRSSRSNQPPLSTQQQQHRDIEEPLIPEEFRPSDNRHLDEDLAKEPSNNRDLDEDLAVMLAQQIGED